MHIFRAMLALLPRDFRERNAREMEEITLSLLRGRSPARRAIVIARASMDALVVAVRLRLGAATRRPGRGAARTTLEAAGQDVAFSARSLRRRASFSLVTALVLGLGVGAATTIYAVVDRVLLRPLPYRDAESIGILWHEFGSSGQFLPALNPRDVWDYRAWSRAFEAFTYGTGREVIVSVDGDARIMSVGPVEAGFFEFFGVRPLLGRVIRATDDRHDAPRVVVLSHRVWTDRFGADAGVLGRTIDIAGEPHEVIGVAPPDFRLELPPEALFLEDAELWTAARLDETYGRGRAYTDYTAFARIAPGVSLAAARADLDRMAALLREQNAAHARVRLRAHLFVLHDDVVKEIRPVLRLLFAAVALMWLVACANAANLMLSRGHQRAWEISLRAALGAGRRRIFSLVIIEALMLSLAGGLLGTGLAIVAIGALRSLAGPALPMVDAVGFGARATAFAIGASLLATLVAGLVPALASARSDPSGVLVGPRTASGSKSSARLRQALVGIEVVASLILLIGGGLLLRSYSALRQTDPGYATGGWLSARVALSPDRFPTPASRRAFFDEVEARLEALPGVTDVAATSQLPLSGRGYQQPYAYDERTRANWEEVSADGRWITPGYFRTIGTRLLAGRELEPGDLGSRVVVIDESLAREAFGSAEAAVDQLLQTRGSREPQEGDYSRVVGVVPHLRLHSLARGALPEMYVPMTFAGQFSGGDHFALVVRGDGDAADLLPLVRREVEAMGSGVALQDLETIADAVARASADSRLASLLMVVFSLGALTLASVGLYGVLALAARRRTKEIAIRIALGQHPGSVIRLVATDGLRVALAATVAGLLLASVAARAASPLLFEVEPTDPLTYGLATVVVLACAGVACWMPARRAARVSPLQALTVE